MAYINLTVFTLVAPWTINTVTNIIKQYPHREESRTFRVNIWLYAVQRQSFCRSVIFQALSSQGRIVTLTNSFFGEYRRSRTSMARPIALMVMTWAAFVLSTLRYNSIALISAVRFGMDY
ncbi:unnamed protein product [Linum trigynum]|uniref:Uncharacterized protein n=1 Tax=Linum trigynum TaxID=586398 RepID=A0AAV2EA96_9ROSI